MGLIEHIARFWESVIYPSNAIRSIGPPPVSANMMAWLTLIGGIIGIIMFIDWLWKFFWSK